MWEKIKSWFKAPEPEEDFEDDIVEVELKIWAILHGPFHKDELPHPNVPDSLNFMVVCKIERLGEVFDQELWFPTLDGVKAWQKHFAATIEPIVITLRY